MGFKKPSRRQLRFFTDEVGPGDGVDPRLTSREARPRVKNRKALQLCRQVEKILNGVLHGECADDVLRDTLVESVAPAPDSSRLLVTVVAASQEAFDPAQVLDHLTRAAGLLRSEVAAAVHRKKAPELVFRVVGDSSAASEAAT